MPWELQMPHEFTTLRHPLERLLEAEYFLVGLSRSSGLEFQFKLNAFLSASRGVTFVLQNAMSGVPNFGAWYEQQQAAMKADAAMRFFIELRNVSQKEGPVSFVGGSRRNGGWTYRFVGRPHAVPSELAGRDIAACCAAHLIKLGNVLLACFEAFPFHACPGLALTEEGMAVLGYSFADLEAALGLPPGYTEVVDFPAAEKPRILSREIEPLDVGTISRIAAGDLRSNDESLNITERGGPDLVDDMVAMLATPEGDRIPARELFIRSVMKRIDDT
jgi:hypothetical protein